MRKLYIYNGVVLILIALCLVFLTIQPVMFPLYESSPYNDRHFTDTTSDTRSDTVATTEKPADSERPKDTQNPTETKEPAITQKTEPIPYHCPDKLTEARNKNPDVYAWISILGTNIDYPVVQSQTSDAYYLMRDIDGNYLPAGSILSEHEYNGTDFEDPVTVLYGHCMASGAMFDNMQWYYSAPNGLIDYQTIDIYLPDKKLEYTVFAAVPYDARHILYNYDFSNPRIFYSFFKSIVSIRSFNASINADEKPESGDKVLILSTCLRSDITQRFLVMAKLKTN